MLLQLEAECWKRQRGMFKLSLRSLLLGYMVLETKTSCTPARLHAGCPNVQRLHLRENEKGQAKRCMALTTRREARRSPQGGPGDPHPQTYPSIPFGAVAALLEGYVFVCGAGCQGRTLVTRAPLSTSSSSCAVMFCWKRVRDALWFFVPKLACSSLACSDVLRKSPFKRSLFYLCLLVAGVWCAGVALRAVRECTSRMVKRGSVQRFPYDGTRAFQQALDRARMTVGRFVVLLMGHLCRRKGRSMQKSMVCHLCGQWVASVTFAHELRPEPEGKTSVLVCEACIRRYRSRLEVLGRDFIFVPRSANQERE